MATFEMGNMWEIFDTGESDLFLITANEVVKKNGASVMGRGLARQAKGKIDGVDFLFGKLIKAYGDHYDNPYGVLTTFHPSFEQQIGIFQVKHHWGDKAKLHLIGHSVAVLIAAINEYGWKRVDCNYPGIGNGGLPASWVMPIIRECPNIVHFWKRGKERKTWQMSS